LILDCVQCIDPGRANQGGRQIDGLREWTADFNVVSSDEGTGYFEPVDRDALRCPDCGVEGRVWAY
jgi:hypothetical protein